MSDFKKTINTYDLSQILDYVERDEIKDSLYETLNFKDKIKISQRHLDDSLNQHRLLNYIYILLIKLQMILFSILLWSIPAIIIILSYFIIDQFNPGFMTYATSGKTNDFIFLINFIIVLDFIFVGCVIIWNILTFTATGDNNSLYTLKGLKHILLEDGLNINKIYFVNYIKLHIIEFNEKILIIFMYIFNHQFIKNIIQENENQIVEYYNEPILNRNKQIFRRHNVIKDINKDELYLISYKYLDSKMKSLSQLERLEQKDQRLYYNSENELIALKKIINEKQSSIYDFKMIIKKLAQLYKLNQIRLSDEKIKQHNQKQKEQQELEESNQKEIDRLVNELKKRQLTYEDQINEQIKHT